MKLTTKNIIAAALFAATVFSSAPAVNAADTPVKREMRSAWVATVWRLDWPDNVVTETGNETQINRQKASMTLMLDSLSKNNFNAINLQVRSRCDAFYQSSYEPWSSDLVATRGMDPGWDPLAWVVEECHKRGMECHAWINPYRYETEEGQWTGPNEYRQQHPDWLLSNGTYVVLNPALPEVKQRIVDVIHEIVANYDVDGILFDDYFYPSGGTPMSADAELYQAYKVAGGTLTQGDWRRENVNDMVRMVYAMIQETKPWVRFGISPAGVAASDRNVAAKYGVEPCPGSDWQYNQIYSDPLAWISAHNLDYISPQVYWTRGYSAADYAKITPWWYTVVDKFARHCYISHDIASLTSSSSGTPLSIDSPLSLTEQQIALPKASGPNNTNYEEYVEQIRMNRNCDTQDAPGSIFYSVKYIYRTSPKFGNYLLNSVFNTPALLPIMSHKTGYNPGNPLNVTQSGNTLNWEGYDNVRYTVYAVPESLPMADFDRQPEYLLGVSYSTFYQLPQSLIAGYNFAVCVLDRYGNEYTPIFAGIPTEQMDAPVTIFPSANSTPETPFEFSWNAVDGAAYYILEISENDDFASPLFIRTVNATTYSTDEFETFPGNRPLYWRVRACAVNHADGISEAVPFNPVQLEITSPSNNAVEVDLNPVIEWNIADRAVRLQLATKDDFLAANIVYEASATGGSHNVPSGILAGYTTYFVRLQYEKDGEQFFCKPVMFTTKVVIPDVPSIVFPADGGEFRSEDRVVIGQVDGAIQARLEVDNKAACNSRNRYVETLAPGVWESAKAGTFKVSNKALESGKVYYFRVRVSYTSPDGTANTDWSPVISATYKGEGSGVDSVNADNAVVSEVYYTLQGVRVERPAADGGVYIRVATHADGSIMAKKVIFKK